MTVEKIAQARVCRAESPVAALAADDLRLLCVDSIVPAAI
jgi:hypothetical protein